jgi:hypothetical protein
MRVRLITTLFLLIAVLCAIPAWAEDRLNAQPADGSPTLKATSDWLAINLSSYGDVDSEAVSGVHITDNCDLVYIHTDASSRYAISVPLGAVNSVSIGRSHGYPSIFLTTAHIAAIRQGEYARDHLNIALGHSPPPIAGAATPDGAERMAERIQKALQHAVDLCRGTYNAPAQTQQPF